MSSQFYLYGPVSQITNLPRGALQSLLHRKGRCALQLFLSLSEIMICAKTLRSKWPYLCS